MEILRPSNTTRELGKPADWDDSFAECQTLPIVDAVIEGQNVMISVWKPTAEELQTLNYGGAIYLWVHGKVHPVVALSVEEFAADESN